ncbi:MAG: hypothetical protein WBW92_09455 [Rhodanobacteraceae bacterium]
MKSLFKLCLPLLATALLASCGGGGGDGHGGFTQPASGKITITAETKDLPLNSLGADPSPGGPFTTEVTITLRRRDGSLINDATTVDVSINPVSVATFSTLDDPSTTDINELLQRYGQEPVKVVAGQATVFVTSYKTAGTAKLTVTSPAVGSLSIQSASMDFTVGNVAAPTPANIDLSSQYPGVYLAGSGGRSSSLITAVVTDAGNQTVPDSDAANVQFEIVGDATNGTLSGDSGSGQTVQVHTTKGVAHASFKAGTVQGPVTVKVTADGADNNVANGISDPVTATTTIVVSDGQLYSLEITSPVFASELPGITVNSLPVSGNTQPASGSTSLIPPDPDATLSLTVSALATDRQGNPVLPGTAIRFGSVDEPVWPFDTTGSISDCNGGSLSSANHFQIAGCDGNPQEGGNLFTAPTGHFMTAGGGAGPGDALVVFGKAVQGNANLESALTVGNINSQTSLNATSSFNLNDTTGNSVNNGAVLPYLIGRSQHGNITATANTNDVGVASAKLTYTVNSVGHAVAIWSQGAGADRVTDALTLTYPGVAPAKLTAFPDPIPGNTTTNVTACLTDALGIPLRGYPISFAFQLDGGSGSVDGVASSGVMGNVTGADGCTTGAVSTNGLPVTTGTGNSGVLNFSAAGATAQVEILVKISFLSAAPGSVCTWSEDTVNSIPAKKGTIYVTAYSQGGGTASGVPVNASCDSGVHIDPASGTTNASGFATFSVFADDGVVGVCTFTATDARSDTVAVGGSGASSSGGFSPSVNCPVRN